MHNKRKGNIAENTVAIELMKRGYSVFKELGDISRIDLIAEKDGKLLRFQVKGLNPIDNTIRLSLTKCGPNYYYRYKFTDFDYVAVVNLHTYKIAFVSTKFLFKTKNAKSLWLRIAPTKNNQSYNVSPFEDFSNL